MFPTSLIFVEIFGANLGLDSKFIEQLQTRLVDFVANTLIVIPAILAALVVLFLTRYAVMAVDRAASITVKKVVRSSSLQSLFVKIARVSTWAAGILVVCTIVFPDLSVGDLIGLLGLGSVAIGFAFQDIFKNFLAGILLLLNEPFKLRDEIIVEGYSGKVEDISIRTTSVRTYQGELVVLPNSVLFTNPVTVLTSQPHRRTDLAIGVDYNTPLPMAREVLARTIASVDGVLSNPEPEVDAVGFGDSSIDFLVRYWTTPQTAMVRRAQSSAIVALKAACDEAGISIPYPIRTVYHFDQHDFDDAASKA
ncbi:MAG: mechanosensitive ion channel family protein [Geitlerinemataceae cyanobacterium]